MDQLSILLERFSVRAGVVYTGNLCGVYRFEQAAKPGHLHLVKSGQVTVVDAAQRSQTVAQPSVIFFPSAEPHALVVDDEAEVVCSTVQFGSNGRYPIAGALPAMIVIRLATLRGMDTLLELVFDEVSASGHGRQAALEKLCELATIRVLRHCIETGQAHGGALAGLADARLAKALTVMHEQPERAWTVRELATAAGMSRARFALAFHNVVGSAPVEYLTGCRIAAAQSLLREGRPVKQVALQVGYASATAFSRAFTRCVGSAPSGWSGADRAPAP
jgi:AraC-like DNA-binding protein